MFTAMTTVLCHENEEEKEKTRLRHTRQDIDMPLICNRAEGIISLYPYVVVLRNGL